MGCDNTKSSCLTGALQIQRFNEFNAVVGRHGINITSRLIMFFTVLQQDRQQKHW